MKKTISLIVLLLISSYTIQAQNTWLKTFGSLEFDHLDRVTTDDSNNVYVAGRMRANMTVGDTTLTKINSSGSYNYFVVKYTESGDFVWALNVDVPAGIDQVSGLACDKLGFVYMAIEKPGTLFKITPNGTVAIKKTMQAGNARLSNVVIDTNLNVWIGGSFSQYNFSLDGLPAMPHLNGTGMYIAKLDSNLTGQMVIPIGSNSLSSRVGRIALKDSLVYVYTNSDNSVYIGNDTIKDARIITASFSKSGNYKWAKGIYLNGTSTGSQHAWDMAVSDNHQVVITGEFYEPIKIDNTVLSNPNDKENFFIASYNKDGSLGWAKRSTTIYSSGNAVQFLANGKIAVIADYSFSFGLGGTTGGDGISNKRYSLMMGLDKDGNTDWIKTLGQKDWTYAVDLAIDKKGNWYLGGNFQATTTNQIDGNNVAVVGEADAYVLKNFAIAAPIVNNTNFCNDNTPKNISAVGNNLSWYSDSLTNNLIQQGGNTLTLNLTADTIVYVTQSSGPAISKPVKVVVKVFALKPVTLTQNGNTLAVQPAIGKSYQWYNNGALLNGINTSSIYATANGTYYAIAIDSNNCKNYTDSIPFVNNGVNEIKGQYLHLFPNPNKGQFEISSNTSGIYYIVNQIGQTVHTFEVQAHKTNTIYTVDLPAGVYSIMTQNANGLLPQKLIIIH
ncbi:MAG: T9SS type A sorting domain-containing protein [Bacteroidota bacterium]